MSGSLWFATAPPIATDDELPARVDVLVVGAGLTGLATALELVRRGRRVTVVEARHVGAATTGNTSAKLSLLQGEVLSGIRDHAGDDALRGYVAANRDGLDWVVAEAGEDRSIARAQTACTYATTPDGDDRIAREYDALRMAGLTADALVGEEARDLNLPDTVTRAIVMPGQWALHPMRLLALLAERLRAAGGRIVERCRVHGADVRGADVRGGGARGGGARGEGVFGGDVRGHDVEVQTDRGTVVCEAVVLATGAPILDRGLFFAKLEPSRAFVSAYELSGGSTLPNAMALSVDDPSRSLRTATGVDGQELLLVGSEGFTPGRHKNPAAVLATLHAWTLSRYPGARRVTWWAAQDYRMLDRLPHAAALPRGGGRIYAATGYNKWGMTNGVAAALAIAGELTGAAPSWTEPLATARPSLQTGLDAARMNVEVGAELAGGWLTAEFSRSRPQPPAEGEGRLERSGVRPTAVSTVDGQTCRLSAVCTHLGGVVRWNDAEMTWDCPLHGSRFDHRGRVLEGPAVEDLAVEPPRAESSAP